MEPVIMIDKLTGTDPVIRDVCSFIYARTKYISCGKSYGIKGGKVIFVYEL
jgi:hypothetical protein